MKSLIIEYVRLEFENNTKRIFKYSERSDYLYHYCCRQMQHNAAYFQQSWYLVRFRVAGGSPCDVSPYLASPYVILAGKDSSRNKIEAVINNHAREHKQYHFLR